MYPPGGPQQPYQPPPQPQPIYVVDVAANAARRQRRRSFHLIMTLITCGLWAPIWIWSEITKGRSLWGVITREPPR